MSLTFSTIIIAAKQPHIHNDHIITQNNREKFFPVIQTHFAKFKVITELVDHSSTKFRFQDNSIAGQNSKINSTIGYCYKRIARH